MILAVASGKGGTGKTTVAVGLACVASAPAWFVDCDTEAPNGHLFLNPTLTASQPVTVLHPQVDLDRCTFCGQCQSSCRFNALAVLPSRVLVFDELCHGCGACRLACPEKAISEAPREIGVIDRGHVGPLAFVQGRLNVGEAKSPPLVRAIANHLPSGGTVILDCPPGTACPAVTSLRNANICLLVTEPTPFGRHDLNLAIAMARTIGVPHGVVLNRDGIGDDGIERLCAEQGVPIVARIPDSRDVAVAYSQGRTALDALPELEQTFRAILDWAHDRVFETEQKAQ